MSNNKQYIVSATGGHNLKQSKKTSEVQIKGLAKASPNFEEKPLDKELTEEEKEKAIAKNKEEL